MIGRFRALRDIVSVPPKAAGPAEAVALFGTSVKQLLHPIAVVNSVFAYTSSGGRVVYERGVDYEVSGTGIRRLAGSAIYDFNSYAFPADSDGTFDQSSEPRNPPIVMFKQVYVDYDPAGAMPVTIPGMASTALSGRLLIAGDSITLGAHTPAMEIYGADFDGYVGMLRRFFSAVPVDKYSASGTYITALAADIDGILAGSFKPSTIVIAYGMNDHVAGGMTGVTAYQATVSAVVAKCQAAGVRVILVGFFRKNDKWRLLDVPAVVAYNSALAAVAAAKSIPFVDIAAAWDTMGVFKHRMLDLTGDNFHHPNIFGQRIYFSKILPHLLSLPISAASAPDYIIMPA